jgi:hypothetical protein
VDPAELNSATGADVAICDIICAVRAAMDVVDDAISATSPPDMSAVAATVTIVDDIALVLRSAPTAPDDSRKTTGG